MDILPGHKKVDEIKQGGRINGMAVSQGSTVQTYKTLYSAKTTDNFKA